MAPCDASRIVNYFSVAPLTSPEGGLRGHPLYIRGEAVAIIGRGLGTLYLWRHILFLVARASFYLSTFVIINARLSE